MSWRSLDKINLILSNSFEIWWCDVSSVLMNNYLLVGILVLRFVIPEACTYVLSLWYEVGAWFIIECLPYEWRSVTSNGIFLPIYPPRGMRSSTLLRGIINFCNKYMGSLWLMWVHGLYALLPHWYRKVLYKRFKPLSATAFETVAKWVWAIGGSFPHDPETVGDRPYRHTSWLVCDRARHVNPIVFIRMYIPHGES